MKSGGKGGNPAHGVLRTNIFIAPVKGLYLVRNNVKYQSTTEAIPNARRPHPVQPVSSEIKKVRHSVPWSSRKRKKGMQDARRYVYWRQDPRRSTPLRASQNNPRTRNFHCSNRA